MGEPLDKNSKPTSRRRLLDLAYYPLFIGGRYLRRKRISYLAIAGVCLSVMTLSVVMSVMKGFDAKLRERVRGQLSHITVEPTDQRLYAFRNWEEVAEEVRRVPEVAAVAPYLEGFALVKVGPRFLHAQFRGVDPILEPQVSDLNDNLTNFFAKYAEKRMEKLREEKPDERRETLERQVQREVESLKERFATDARSLGGLYPDVNDAKIPGAFIGAELYRYTYQDIVLVTATPDLRRRIRKFRIRGIFKSGMYDYDSSVIIISLQAAMSFVDSEGGVTGLSVRLKDYRNCQRMKFELTRLLQAGIRRSSLLNPPALIERLRNAAGPDGDPTLVRIMAECPQELKQQIHAYKAGDAVPLPLLNGVVDLLNRALRDPGLCTDATVKGLPSVDFYRGQLALHPTGLNLVHLNRMILSDRFSDLIDRMAYFKVQTWEDKRRTILNAVHMERIVMAFILTFIMIVAGFCIFAILTMTIFEKRRDIGILKAVGMTKLGIGKVFLFDGFAIGLIGAGLGLTFSLLIINYINTIERFIARHTGWTPFPRDVYYFDKIPTDKGLALPLVVCAAALFFSLLFSVIPAWRAARQDPIETLRFE